MERGAGKRQVFRTGVLIENFDNRKIVRFSRGLSFFGLDFSIVEWEHSPTFSELGSLIKFG